MNKPFFHLFFLLFGSINASAQTVTIYRAGLATSPSYMAIKPAVLAALPNDSLVLSADTFKENMILIDKNLSITGIETASSKCTIDAMNDSSAIIFSNPDPSSTLYLLIQHTNIINGVAHNDAGKGGGAICADYNTVLTIRDKCYLYKNEASSSSPNGGAIYSLGTVIVSNNATIVNNKAAGSGGGIFSTQNCIVSDSSMINYNTANLNGGGIFTNGMLKIQNFSSIDSNEALSGGGIYSTNGDVYLAHKVNLNSNYAHQLGGAVALIGSHLSAKDSVKFSFNATDTNFGAAIFARGNNDIYIKGANFFSNFSTNEKAATNGMAVYNDYTTGGSSIVSINSSRVFNQLEGRSRQNEVYNIHPSSAFISDSTWWGESDTSGLIYNGLGATMALRTWTVADWSVNAGAPVGSVSSFPIEAYFRLNSGGILPPNFHWMLQGVFLCDSGKFTPVNPFMNAGNIVGTVYSVPFTSNTAHIVASVDADTFKKNIWVIGLNLKEQSLNSSLSFQLYPNPSNGNITLIASEKMAESITTTVYDLLGKVVFQKDLLPNTIKNDLNINASNGQYILELKNKMGNEWRQRILIQ